jgi:hypothetical protein
LEPVRQGKVGQRAQQLEGTAVPSEPAEVELHEGGESADRGEAVDLICVIIMKLVIKFNRCWVINYYRFRRHE